jgi:acetate CoA/acetoacetate CoA-transferase alpha subunit
VEEGKEKINIEGNDYLLELPINADIALVKAWKADKKGNLVYRKSARNFNPLIAKACELVIVEAEEIVEVGQLDPDHVMTSGIFVDYIARGDK